jgi:hypothetical protein
MFVVLRAFLLRIFLIAENRDKLLKQKDAAHPMTKMELPSKILLLSQKVIPNSEMENSRLTIASFFVVSNGILFFIRASFFRLFAWD